MSPSRKRGPRGEARGDLRKSIVFLWCSAAHWIPAFARMTQEGIKLAPMGSLTSAAAVNARGYKNVAATHPYRSKADLAR